MCIQCVYKFFCTKCLLLFSLQIIVSINTFQDAEADFEIFSVPKKIIRSQTNFCGGINKINDKVYKYIHNNMYK